jgi:chromosomal replication initiator protein
MTTLPTATGTALHPAGAYSAVQFDAGMGALAPAGQPAQSVWPQAQAVLRSRMNTSDFEAWIQPLHVSGWDEHGMHISSPTRFITTWVERHFKTTLEDILSTVAGQSVSVILYTSQPLVTAIQNSVHTTPTASAPSPTAPVHETPTNPEWIRTARLDTRFTFDTFVTGKNNQFAFSAAKSVGEQPIDKNLRAFNPLFIHGNVGLGKTHLMHAVGWAFLHANPTTRLMVLSAEQFLQIFVRALKEKNSTAFKDAFRNIDVLMIDDVQFIAGKDSTQEEFFHTFNALVNQGKQIVLTADKSPHELAGVEDRLKSRLGCGLTVEVHAPEVETRLAILEKKAADMQLDLPNDVAMLLATTIASNVRELEGALNRLAAFSRLTATALSVDFAREQLRDLFRVHTRATTIDDIQKTVAEFFKIRVADMHSPRRSRDVARPRQVAMYLAKTLTSRSYPDIGRAFGGRDHTTVMHACEQINNLKERDRELDENVRLLEKMLRTA